MESRYLFDTISKVCDIPVYRLEARRRLFNLNWHPKGYTLEEVQRLLMGVTLRTRDEINPRAYKALELLDRLTKEANQ